MNQAVHLVDAQRVLGLFAQGIAGRYLHLKPSQTLTGNFRPAGVTTDGNSIFLPDSIALFAGRRENLGVYRIAVLHQVGLHVCGTYAFSLEQARERIADLPPEPTRLGDANVPLARFFALWPRPELMRRLFMSFEDMRVDRTIARRFPGARADLERVLEHALATRPALTGMSRGSALLEGLLRYTLGASRDSLSMIDRTGKLDAMLDLVDQIDEDADVYSGAHAAVLCYRMLATPSPNLDESAAVSDDQTRRADGPPGGGGDEAGDEAEDGIEAADVEFRGEVRPELVQRQMRIASLVARLEQADTLSTEPESAAAMHEAQRRKQLEADRVAIYRAFGQLETNSRSFVYDEWDFHGQRYLRGWCRLYEKRLRGTDFEFIDRVRQRHAGLVRQIRRQFSSLRPESYRRERPLRDGEQLDLDAIIDSVLTRRSGQSPDERVYMRRERGLREVACALLLDMSASTDYPIPDPLADAASPPAPGAADDEDPYLWAVSHAPDALADTKPPPRRVIDVAREALALMCQALETLGDSHAVYGFSGQGREEVEFYVAKDFDDRLSARSWASIAEMKPRRSTRMGPAIRHASSRLRARDARTRLLIVISDGFPEDQDYGPDRNDHEYGIQDTGQALREAERDGIRTFCVTVDRAGRDYLRRMCAPERYMVIDEIEALPEALTKVYRSLIR